MINLPDEVIEAAARAIADSYGEDPNEFAPLSQMTTADGYAVQWWCVFEEQANGFSRLTAADVLAIRASTLGSRRLGKQYGVDKMTIKRVRRRETWAHISAAPNPPAQDRREEDHGA